MLFLFFQTEKQARRFLRVACFFCCSIDLFLPRSPLLMGNGSIRIKKIGEKIQDG